MAACPSCGVPIEWSKRECAACGALFEGADAWRPVSQTAEESQLLAEKYSTGRAIPLPVAGIGAVLRSTLFVGASSAAVLLLYMAMTGTIASTSTSFAVVAAVGAACTAAWYLVLLLAASSMRSIGAVAGFLAGLLVLITLFMPAVYYAFFDQSEVRKVTYVTLAVLVASGAWLLPVSTAIVGWLAERLLLTVRQSDG
jgi:hypothetical protein